MSASRGTADGPGPSGRRALFLHRYSNLALALTVAGIVAMMILPLPTFALDLLITLNLAIAVTLLLLSISVSDAIRIATFPAILLITTLYRLGLNISSTRLILLQGDAGRVIDSFGHFVVAGNYVVGAVVFLILLIVQFVVIAKGSERVAEVAARFALDALPGKQLALDADLRSGLIDRNEARRLRRALQRESQFYGAMDGAMKFVKGDAVAGIVITCVNITAGIAIGVLQRGLDVGEALRLYGLLTIGDGLVSQIPALVISTAAGLVVTRVASEEPDTHLGEEISGQVLAHPRALFIVAGLLALLGLVPGLPLFPFLLLSALTALAAWGVTRSRRRRAGDRSPSPDVSRADTTLAPEPLLLGLGVDIAQSRRDRADLVDALEALRDQLRNELGIEIPAIPIRRAPEAEAGDREIVLLIDEIPAARVEMPIDANTKEIVGALGDTLRHQAGRLVGIREVQAKLDALQRTHPDLLRAVLPDIVDLPQATEVFRRLVDEGVSVRNVRIIVEALLEYGPNEKDPVALTEHVRAALSHQITHQYVHDASELAVFQLSADIEEEVRAGIQRSETGTYLALDPELCRDIIDALRGAIAQNEQTSAPVVLTQPDVRRFLRKLFEAELPEIVVLSPRELEPTVTIHQLALVDL